MRRLVRRLAWVGLALCVVALAFGGTKRLLEAMPGVREANLRRIREGMSRADVEGLLGGPGERAPASTNWVACSVVGERLVYRWTWAEGKALIEFTSCLGPDDRVLTIFVQPQPASNRQGLIRSLRSLLGW